MRTGVRHRAAAQVIDEILQLGFAQGVVRLHRMPADGLRDHVFAELRDAGFLAARPGIGMVVTVPRMEARAALLDHLTPACGELLREAAMLQLPLEEVLEAVRRTAKASGFKDPK